MLTHRIFWFLLLFFCVESSSDTQLSTGIEAANAILNRYQPTIDVITHAGWDHSNSVVLHGMEKLYRHTGDRQYLSYIQKFVDSFVQEDGSVKGLNTNIDGMHPGVLCLFLYEQTGDKKYLLASKALRDHVIGENSVFNKTPDGAFWHKNSKKYKNVATVDGLYMVHPFLLRYGLIANDSKAVNTALDQVLLVSERSFNIKYNLPYHAWSYDKTAPWAHPITGTSTQFWSRAAGWYAMTLADMLEVLPESHEKYLQLKFLFTSLAVGLKQVQNPTDGFWYQVLERYDEARNYPELSGTGMIIYALQKGVDIGVLDTNFEKITSNAWLALKSKISVGSDGMLQINSFCPGMGAKNTYAEYVGVEPVSIPSKQNEKQHMHGYMAVLMASSVMEF